MYLKFIDKKVPPWLSVLSQYVGVQCKENILTISCEMLLFNM